MWCAGHRCVGLAFLVALALVLEWSGSSAWAQDVRNGLTEDMVRTFSLKQIRFELQRRHVTCDGCVEKEHFLNKLLESLDVPVDKTVLTMNSNNDATGPSSSSSSQRKQSQQQKKRKVDLNDEDARPDATTSPSDVDMEGLYESIMKKKKDNDKVKEALRKAGIDTSGMRGGGGGDAFSGDAFEKWAKEYERKRGGRGGKRAPGKKAGGDVSDDDGAVSDGL